MAAATALHQVLEDEFQALKNRDLDTLEQGFPNRDRLLRDISAVGDAPEAEGRDDDPDWPALRQALDDCKNLQRRNQLLIQHQLDAVRHTLKALTGNKEDAVETYDRLGRLAHSRHQRLLNDG